MLNQGEITAWMACTDGFETTVAFHIAEVAFEIAA
jgi:hypothetical protein